MISKRLIYAKPSCVATPKVTGCFAELSLNFEFSPNFRSILMAFLYDTAMVHASGLIGVDVVVCRLSD